MNEDERRVLLGGGPEWLEPLIVELHIVHVGRDLDPAHAQGAHRLVQLASREVWKLERDQAQSDETPRVVAAQVGDERVRRIDDLFGNGSVGPVAEVGHVTYDLHVDALTVHRFEPHADVGEARSIVGPHQVFVVRIGRARVAGGQFDESRRKRMGMDVNGPGRLGQHRAMVAAAGPLQRTSEVSCASVAVSASGIEQALAASIPGLARTTEPFRVLDGDGRPQGFEPDLSAVELRSLYRWMVFGRQLDERGMQLQRQGRIGVWGPMIGQEAAQAGLGLAMQSGDWIFPSYREAIVLSMRGLDLVELFAYYRGLYWVADPARTGVFPVQIVIGDQALHAVGAGMGFSMQHQPHVAVGAVGDGATSQGDFMEALNFAGVFNAQAVLFVQNNHWAISLPRTRQTLSETLAQKGLAQGVTGVLVDGNDALAVYAVCHWAIERARAGQGPALIEALTYRLGAHTTADDPRRYQPTIEINEWRARDPLPRMRRYLEYRGLWDADAERDAIVEALARIDRAVEQAEATPIPTLANYVEAANG
jgi:pyruvate dehydrogenase E1 component alpha subunit